MNPKKPALVLIGFQNDFTTDGGTLQDCMAATRHAEREAAQIFTHPMFSHPTHHGEFLAEVQGAASAGDNSRRY